MFIEVSCGSVEETMLALNHGADRIEICHALSTGGVTPSPGLWKIIRKQTDKPIFVMIAQPEANFITNLSELDSMILDIEWFLENGADGFVFGCLTNDNKIDERANSMLVTAAQGRPCTFHRAFDCVPGPVETAQRLADMGFTRILTSGGAESIEYGLDVLEQLFNSKVITVLPGGGVRPENAKKLMEIGATELHCSIRRSSQNKGYLGYPLPDFDPNRISLIKKATSSQ